MTSHPVSPSPSRSSPSTRTAPTTTPRPPGFPFRYPLEDVEIAGVRIPRGEAIMAPYSAVGRDEGQHGADAGTFDIARERRRHLGFGHGPRFCLGAPLARLEAALALPAVFARYPGLTLAADPDRLTPVPSLFSNSTTTLPVRLTAGD